METMNVVLEYAYLLSSLVLAFVIAFMAWGGIKSLINWFKK